MSDAFLILLMLGLCAWAWYSNRAAHEKVLKVSRFVCLKLNVQRLDDTVALRRVRIGWGRQGPVIRRLYRFEFSTDGVNRRIGEISLFGSSLDWVRVDQSGTNEFIVIDA